MAPHIREMMFRWPPVLGVVGLLSSPFVGRLIFGQGHLDGTVVGVVFGLGIGAIFGLVGAVYAITEPRRFRTVRSQTVNSLVYVVDAFLVVGPIALIICARL